MLKFSTVKSFLDKHWFSFILLWMIITLYINKADMFHNHYQFDMIEKSSWQCIEDWTVMYSKNLYWNIWSADKWCTCTQIREYEMKLFWEVDEESMKNDFGC